MPRGISLHVGINQVSSAFPGATPLKGCENDAREMEKIAIAKKFEVHDLLLGSDATYALVTAKIRSAAAQLEKDDLFLFTFAGHGFQETDIGIDRDELDALDETLLLFDVELFDDVLRKELWPCFKPGVRVLMVADSCHSGSSFLLPPGEEVDASVAAKFPVTTSDKRIARTIRDSTARRHQIEYGEFYRSTLMLPIYRLPINASLLLLAACEDTQTTGDDDSNGVYTAAMLNVLKTSDPLNYVDLVERIQKELPNQTPTLKTGGAENLEFGAENLEFKEQKPFTI